MADWLFSMDTLKNGSPTGIGLSAWRFNFGAGSAQQGDASGIKDEWRRADSFLNEDGSFNWSRQQGQLWFLTAARKRGVSEFIGFVNSPPVQYTRNRKAFATKGLCNIDSSQYGNFANYIAEGIKAIKQKTGINFSYLSPVNEPQWDWSDGGQEGSPYQNDDIAGLVKSFNYAFKRHKLSTRILTPEAGELYYLYENRVKPGRGSQIDAFFNPLSPQYIGNLSHVSKTVAAHSYFTSSSFNEAVKTRQKLQQAVAKYKDLKFWQSEYCILGDNHGEIKGGGKDLGIDPAIYVAKLIYNDLVNANATAWQWWLAISPYNYKDGLIYVDKNKADGAYTDSKILWALGNYSRFIRTGMQRVAINQNDDHDLFTSAYIDKKKKQIVMVTVNEKQESSNLEITIPGRSSPKSISVYTTSASQNLEKSTGSGKVLTIPARSITTVVFNY